ncbi:MAG: peptide chain release factor N(5)-glutamine methyltransferase [Firmicutes bacterium]|nr:peptide chain release factor N(5)-glutamine methyltransferase [Bacillota bacterium]
MTDHRLTFREALERASTLFKGAGISGPRREAEFLIARVMGWDRLKLFLESDTALPPGKRKEIKQAVARRARGEPLAYITGSRFFYGLKFMVDPAVLIPRPESELLIESALDWAEGCGYKRGGALQVLDLGTGSGNLAVTLATRWPEAIFYAVDISPKALAVAAVNASRHRVQRRISWHQGSYFSALAGLEPPPKFNLVLSNPPYIPHDELAALPPSIKEFEPLQALDGGADGLEGYRKLLSALPSYLRSPALVAVEIGAGQREKVVELFKATGLFQRVAVVQDYQGWPRVIKGFSS